MPEESRNALAALGHPVQWHTYPMPRTACTHKELKDISRFANRAGGLSGMAASGNLTLGIDFGTSNSAAAVLQADGKLHAIALEGERTSLPTALFFHADDGHVEYGSAALAAYLSGAEGRLMRSIKSLLGSKLMDEQTVINGRAASFFDIVVLFFKELKSRSEKRMGHTVTSAVLGRPVHL